MIKRILAQGVLAQETTFRKVKILQPKSIIYILCFVKPTVGTKRTNHLKGHEKLIENIMYLFCVPLFISLT